jgi:hypothetical protein
MARLVGNKIDDTQQAPIYAWAYDTEREDAIVDDAWQSGDTRIRLRHRILAAKVARDLLENIRGWEEREKEVTECARSGAGADIPGLRNSMLAAARSVKRTEKTGLLRKEAPTSTFVTALVDAWRDSAANLLEATWGLEGDEASPRCGPVRMPDNLRRFLQNKATRLDALRSAWSRSIGATETDPVSADALAGKLADAVFEWALERALEGQ